MTDSDAGELQTAFPSCKRGTNLYVRRTATDLGRTVVIFVDKLQLFRLHQFVDRSTIASGDRVDGQPTDNLCTSTPLIVPHNPATPLVPALADPMATTGGVNVARRSASVLIETPRRGASSHIQGESTKTLEAIDALQRSEWVHELIAALSLGTIVSPPPRKMRIVLS